MQIKDFASITASMIAWMRASQSRVTDFEQGSVARTLLEAPAAEIEELYQQMFTGIREAIPVAVYRTFGFEPLAPTPAAGTIRVTIAPISAATVIPTGTIFQRVGTMPGAATYLSLADATIAANASWVDVAVAADRPGTIGNTPPNVSFAASPQPLGLISAISTGGIIGGTDGETDDARRARFAEYIASLQRGTHRALKYGATLATVTNAAGLVTERVASASIVEPYLSDPVTYGPALVWVYIENRASAPSAALITRCQQILDGYEEGGIAYPGWKAAGVQVEVRAATRTTINVSATLTALPGYDAPSLRQATADIIAAYLDNLPIATPALRADMIRDAMNIEGVGNFILTAPAADVTATATTKLAAGTVTIA